MAKQVVPLKPRHREADVWFWKHLQMFKSDIFMAQPPKLYRAWMAAMRLPRFWSYFVNDPKVLRTVLKERPDDFPKSEIINATLASLLGTGSLFQTAHCGNTSAALSIPLLRAANSVTTFNQCLMLPMTQLRG